MRLRMLGLGALVGMVVAAAAAAVAVVLVAADPSILVLAGSVTAALGLPAAVVALRCGAADGARRPPGRRPPYPSER